VEITRAEVLKIAELAKLHFPQSELDAFLVQFQRILDYIEKLKEVNVEGIEPTSHVALSGAHGSCHHRGDETRPSLPVEEALMNAPDRGEDQFGVPKVIG
jgi:aspartyl-tRNA(Asn)/glutamyl-tRNA(Gln) amidotransferase subunit C